MKKQFIAAIAALVLIGSGCTKDVTNPSSSPQNNLSSLNSQNATAKQEYLPTLLGSDKLLTLGNCLYANPLNPQDNIGRIHNQLVDELESMNYSGLSDSEIEERVKLNLRTITNQRYPGVEKINLNALNSVPGFEGHYYDLNFDNDYRAILNAASNNSPASKILADYIDEARALSAQIISNGRNQTIPSINLVTKASYMTALINLENKYIAKIASASMSQTEKDKLYMGLAIMRYSTDQNTDDADPVPNPAALGKKWWIIVGDVLGGAIGGLAASPGVFTVGLGVIEGAAAGSAIADLLT